MKGYRARPQTSPLTASSGQDRGALDGDPGLCDLRETVHLFRSMKCDRCNTSLDFIPRLGQFHNSLPLQSYTQNPPPIPLYKGGRYRSSDLPLFHKEGRGEIFLFHNDSEEQC